MNFLSSEGRVTSASFLLGCTYAAAVISPVGSYLLEDGREITVGDGGIGKHSRTLYELYSAIQIGKTPAPAGWLTKVPKY